MALVVRKGKGGDLPEVFDQIKELALFDKSRSSVTNSAQRMNEDKDLFDFFVAEQDGKIIGYALYFFSYSTWVGKSLYLEDLYVKPQFRRRKVGSRLLQKIFEIAKKEKCKRVRWQVLDWNSSAIQFYTTHGAQIHKEWLNCDFDEQGIAEFLEKADKE